MPRTTLSVPLDPDNPVEARIADAVRSCPPHARHLAVVEALGIGLAVHGLRGILSPSPPVSDCVPDCVPDCVRDCVPDPGVATLDPAPVDSLEDFMSSFRC